jgi:hypothetical protein
MLCRGDRRSPSFLSPLVATGSAQNAGCRSSWSREGLVFGLTGAQAVRSYSGTMITEVSDFVPCHLIGVLEQGVGRKSRETQDTNSPSKNLPS